MIAALIVAAGRGRRLGADLPKQYLKLAGESILSHTLNAFDSCALIHRIFLVIPSDDLGYCQDKIIGPAARKHPVTLVAGGERRQDSVLNGLHAIDASEGIVLIHDGVRPFITTALIEACVAGAKKYGACIPAVPVYDTLKQVSTEKRIEKTVPRKGLFSAQTPQSFELSIIIKAHAEALQHGWKATDDASLVERMGASVHIVRGLRENIKITTAEDLAWAGAYLDARAQAR